jgi:hypothetical protein
MHWVVCKTQRVKEIERDFRESLREESEQLGGHISQEKRAQIPRQFFCVSVVPYFLLLGRTVRIRTVRTTREGTIFEAVLWHENRGSFFGFFFVAGPYCAGRTTLCWARFSRHKF